jgi:hypothetical protein
MKIVFLIPTAALFLVSAVWAQYRIYRCGNEYTNTVTEAQAKSCKLISGGNVTVVQAHKPNANRVAAATQPAQRVDSGEQRAKDSDSRLILESELKRAEARRADLLKEYNNGEPEKLGPELRNQQKYLERVAELKASISRNDKDIDGIRRELTRVPAAAASSSASSQK